MVAQKFFVCCIIKLLPFFVFANSLIIAILYSIQRWESSTGASCDMYGNNVPFLVWFRVYSNHKSGSCAAIFLLLFMNFGKWPL
jgi:hypothetical protein